MRNMKNQDIDNKILSDRKENGKERPWAERKGQSVNVSGVLEWGSVADYADYMHTKDFAEAQEALSFYTSFCTPWLSQKSEKMRACGEVLEFAEDAGGNKKLYRAWFCKDRLCPMCNWRRSVKLRGQMLKILTAMKDRGVKGRPIFLTLTMQNVTAENINKSFSDFALAFRRMMDYKEVKAVCLGAVRSSEITYNKKRKDYNTHIHCLLWMTPDYFAGRNYINQEKWTQLWKRAAKLDYTPVVNVKIVKPAEPTETDKTGYIKAVLEVTKYTAKPTAVPGLDGVPWKASDKVKMEMGKRIAALERGLYRKRLIGLFGIFKELHKELNLDDTEDGDLIGADEGGDGEAVTAVRYNYDYTRHNYYLTGRGTIDRKNYSAKYDEEEEDFTPAAGRDVSIEDYMQKKPPVKAESEQEPEALTDEQKRQELLKKNGAKNGTVLKTSEVKGTVE